MVEWVTQLAGNPAAAWGVLIVVSTIAFVEIIRSSKETLWGEFYAEELDD